MKLGTVIQRACDWRNKLRFAECSNEDSIGNFFGFVSGDSCNSSLKLPVDDC